MFIGKRSVAKRVRVIKPNLKKEKKYRLVISLISLFFLFSQKGWAAERNAEHVISDAVVQITVKEELKKETFLPQTGSKESLFLIGLGGGIVATVFFYDAYRKNKT